MVEKNPYDLYVVGLGIVSVRQLTREAESAMRQSREVLYASDAIGIEGHLRTLCDRVTEVYVSTLSEGEERLPKYNKIAARVLDAALDHPPVTFAIAGHPLVFVVPHPADPEGRRRARPAGEGAAGHLLDGHHVHRPGSSTRGRWACRCTRRRDCCCSAGCCSRTCRASCGRSARWRPGCSPGRPSLPHRFARLQEYLTQYYPPDHLVRIVYSASHPLASASVLEFRIDEMHLHAAKIHAGATLYLPPVGQPEVKDHELAALVDSLDHLRSVTQPSDQPPGRAQRRNAVASASRVAR